MQISNSLLQFVSNQRFPDSASSIPREIVSKNMSQEFCHIPYKEYTQSTGFDSR